MLAWLIFVDAIRGHIWGLELADLGAQKRNTVEACNSPKLAIQLPPVGSNPSSSAAKMLCGM